MKKHSKESLKEFKTEAKEYNSKKRLLSPPSPRHSHSSHNQSSGAAPAILTPLRISTSQGTTSHSSPVHNTFISSNVLKSPTKNSKIEFFVFLFKKKTFFFITVSVRGAKFFTQN